MPVPFHGIAINQANSGLPGSSILMDFLIIAVVAFAPGLFWLWHFFKKDKIHPEPLYLIRKCFLWGMAGIVPAGLVELSLAFTSAFW
jgi:RsiW-degrading membrane proteinase PrsW (M82 family)